MTVTGEQVFEAFKLDSHVEGPDDPQLPLMEPFVKALPDILGDSLDETLSLKLLIDVKLRFIKYITENGFAEQIRVTMKDILGDSLDETVELLTSALGMLAEQMQEMLPELDQMLADQGVTEEDIFTSDQVGLNEDMLAHYRAGTLTLDVLLANQPGVVIVNES